MKLQPEFSYNLSVDAVADYFVHCDMQRSEPDVTPLKLQKLLYLAQANFIASTDERLFDEPVEAFRHGPVVYRTYAKYSGSQIIAARENSSAGSADQDMPADTRDFLDKIWLRYKDFSAGQLRNLTHTQDPWVNHYVENSYRTEIPDEDMARYYRQAVPASERVFHDSVALVPEGFIEALDEDEMSSQLRAFWS